MTRPVPARSRPPSQARSGPGRAADPPGGGAGRGRRMRWSAARPRPCRGPLGAARQSTQRPSVLTHSEDTRSLSRCYCRSRPVPFVVEIAATRFGRCTSHPQENPMKLRHPDLRREHCRLLLPNPPDPAEWAKVTEDYNAYTQDAPDTGASSPARRSSRTRLPRPSASKRRQDADHRWTVRRDEGSPRRLLHRRGSRPGPRPRAGQACPGAVVRARSRSGPCGLPGRAELSPSARARPSHRPDRSAR